MASEAGMGGGGRPRTVGYGDLGTRISFLGCGGDAWGVEEHYWVLAVRTMEEMARQGRWGQGEWLGADAVIQAKGVEART